ncbi:cyclohexanone monooxygenase [Paraphoma chrysanthemicola]|uniref:Cyclohexanone monooxygenase n=1 Tax=Paraphoma chrysanthemicola TaxID=798071 RepID=A0A8K0R9W3_9PLEO|nr:cyclohexanone monooxygenase [Paraphoma chrysanthemicola]
MSPSAVKEPYRVSDQPNGRLSKIKAICIGAGASGLYLAYSMERRMKNYELTVYEKNNDIGGTWLENRYPGCACDVPAHIYTYTFRPNPRWSSYFAGSKDIYQYFKDFEQEYKLNRYIQFNHVVTSAIWDDEKCIYNVTVKNSNGELIHDWCHVLINGSGVLNAWKWPDIPGLSTFKGHLLHSAAWDDNINLEGKQVAVIGTGSSGIQITPIVQKKAAHLDVFIRSPTWVVPNLVERILAKGSQSHSFTQEEIDRFERDPNFLLKLRRRQEVLLDCNTDVFRLGSKEQKATEDYLRGSMKEALKNSPDIMEHLIPDFPPGCRRLTPGTGYLDSLQAKNVACVYDTIESFTEDSIRTVDGKLHKADVIICATGFDVSYVPHFELKGRDGLRMADAWSSEPLCYLGIAARGFPNYFIVVGPRGPWGNGTIIPAMELNSDYFITVMQKIQREQIKFVEVKEEAVEDFIEHCDEWHVGQTRSVWSATCRSWYKRGTTDGNPVLWCGMLPSYLKAMYYIRYEDYDWHYKSRNRFQYLGNGKIEAEYKPALEKADAMAPFIRTSETPWTIE